MHVYVHVCIYFILDITERVGPEQGRTYKVSSSCRGWLVTCTHLLSFPNGAVCVHLKLKDFLLIQTYKYIYTHIHRHMYMYAYLRMDMYICIHIHIWICSYVYIHTFSNRMCVYIYIYIYMYIFIYTHRYICLSLLPPRKFNVHDNSLECVVDHSN